MVNGYSTPFQCRPPFAAWPEYRQVDLSDFGESASRTSRPRGLEAIRKSDAPQWHVFANTHAYRASGVHAASVAVPAYPDVDVEKRH